MRFELSEDQQEIQRSARELLAGRSSFAQVRAAAEAGRVDAPGESDAPQGMGDLLAAGGAVRRARTPRSGANSASSAGPGSRSPRSTAARASA